MDSKELKYGNDVDTVGQQQSEGKKIFNRFDNRKWEGGKTEKNENDGKQRQVVPNEELEKGRKEAESAKTTVDKRRIATEEMEGKSK